MVLVHEAGDELQMVHHVIEKMTVYVPEPTRKSYCDLIGQRHYECIIHTHIRINATFVSICCIEIK
jgi:hypothetical protein